MEYRQRIIEEAAVMFRTYGIRAVTMDMLANQMGISKRTIYEVFKDKDELLEGVLKWMSVKQKELMKKILSESDNTIEAVFKLLDLMNQHFRNMSPAFRMDMKRYHTEVIKKLEANGESPYFENNREILTRGIEEGLFRNDIDVNTTNKCLLELGKMANDTSAFPPEDFMNQDVIRSFYINYLRGISTPKGLDLISYYEKKQDGF
jgi:AcrR family transcriptional regulator